MTALGAISTTAVVPQVSTGTTAPASTPTTEGDIYVDTTGDNVWMAKGTASSADWVQVNAAGGGLANVVEDTTPQLGGQLDVNTFGLGDGTNLLLDFVEDASAVNYLQIENQATGGGPILRSTGTDANVDLHLDTKGTGQVVVDDTLSVTGNILVTGTVDGRDIAADGSTLDGLTGNGDYTVTNNSGTDRTIDVAATTVNEVADVLGNVIADLISAGIFT